MKQRKDSLILILLMLTNNSYSAEYFIDPSIRFGLELDDNIRLTNLEHSTVAGAVSEGKVDFGYATERSSIRLSPGLRVTRYSEDVGRDREDIVIDVSGSHLISEKNSLSLNATYKDEVIGIQEANVEGINFEEFSKTTKSISPGFVHSFNDRSQLQFSLATQEVIYDEGVAARLTSYEYKQATLAYSYSINQRNLISVQASHSDYEALTAGTEISTNSIQTSITHVFDESLRFSAGVGLTSSTTEFDAFTPFGIVRDEESVTGSLFDISVNKRFETSSLNLAFNRSVSPGARGDQEIRDSWILKFKRQLSEKMQYKLDIDLFQNESQSTFSAAGNDFEYFQIRTGLDYSLSRQWRVDGSYRYRRVEDSNTGSSRDSNSVFFNLIYDFDKWSFSR